MLRAALLAALLATPDVVGADEPDEREPPVAVAVGAGGGVAFVTLLAGSLLFASSTDDSLHRTGIYVAMAGLTIAPAAAHLFVHEYKRAAIFAALPLAALVANVAVLQVDPQVMTLGSPATRVPFGVALTAAVLGGVVGLADTFGARDRFRARHRLLAAPTIVPGGAGLGVGARF